MAIEIEKVKNILALDKSKEDIVALKSAISDNFKGIWMFHHYNTGSERRGLEVCNTWGVSLDEERMNEIKKFADEFLIDRAVNSVSG